MSTDDAQISGMAWKMGWHPLGVIIAVTIVATIIGTGIEAIAPLFGLGLLAGATVGFWGTREVNDNYEPLLKKFISEANRKAARGIEVNDASTYSLTYGNGDSPFLVKPSRSYFNTTLVLSDTSANINKGSEYNMEAREGVGGGSNRELFYDQISAVESHQDGNYTTLEIRTSGGDSLEISSTNTDTVDQALSDLRKRVRNAKTMAQ